MIGSIARLMDKGFGFIAADHPTQFFFHRDCLVGLSFDALKVGMVVHFDADAASPRGPRASKVWLE